MPTWLICVPLAFQWLRLAMKYGSASLPSSANPDITSGGLVGEGKLEYFRGMGPIARAATAAHCAIDTNAHATRADVRAAMAAAALAFPVIAKPNLGMCGHGVRLIEGEDDLAAYRAAFPSGETIVLQQYLADEGEAGIFYARRPGDERGRVLGIALRHFPQVTGDGESTVAELIEADPRARRLFGSRRHEAPQNLDAIPPEGERVRLATIGSTRIGGLYRDGAALCTPALAAAIDAIARDMPRFYFGRFDVRFAGMDDLRAGRFTIIEVNGAGSEAIQAWDPETPLFEAFRTIFAKQRLLFEIAAANRAAGCRPIGIVQLARLHFRQRRLIGSYPPSN